MKSPSLRASPSAPHTPPPLTHSSDGGGWRLSGQNLEPDLKRWPIPAAAEAAGIPPGLLSLSVGLCLWKLGGEFDETQHEEVKSSNPLFRIIECLVAVQRKKKDKEKVSAAQNVLVRTWNISHSQQNQTNLCYSSVLIHDSVKTTITNTWFNNPGVNRVWFKVGADRKLMFNKSS